MKVLYLYAELMGYTMATIRELCERHGAEIHVVHWDIEKLTPYQHEYSGNVTFYPRSSYSTEDQLKDLAMRIRPDLAVVSGWQDKGYLPAARLLRKDGIPVVVGFDDQWHGTLRQYAASYLTFFMKCHFSHAWVSGPYQYEYARRMGFGKRQIVFDIYSADLHVFNGSYSASINAKEANYPHRFLFVGRFEKIKGVDLLIKAWHALGNKKKDWELVCIGNGSLRNLVKEQNGIVVHDFMQPAQLQSEVSGAGCFILPSRSEPWGVVIHEFAAAGLPIICSDRCGAAAVFLIDGLNGFRFKSEDIDSLIRQLQHIVDTDDQELLQMSEYSHQLGQRITPALSAASLISIIKVDHD